MIALAVGSGVGINTAMAFFFGIKKEKRAAETAGVGTPLAFAIWLLFARFGLYYFWLTYLITEIITSAVGFAMFSRFGNNTTTPCKV